MKIENAVLKVLSEGRSDGRAYYLPTGQLDRKMYERVNKVLESAGGKWSRKDKAHLFDVDAADRLDQIILTGEVEVPKDEFNYFPTPPEVVSRMMDIADIDGGMRVLEPSAGKGAIAYQCARHGATVDCIELMDANYGALAGDMKLGTVTKADFLTVEPTPIYDRVVMNPPFLKQNDIKHVLHALKFLKPDGLLVSVMASSVVFRDNSLTTGFRDLVDERGGSIEALPEGSFKASGTMVNTVIATIPGAT